MSGVKTRSVKSTDEEKNEDFVPHISITEGNHSDVQNVDVTKYVKNDKCQLCYKDISNKHYMKRHLLLKHLNHYCKYDDNKGSILCLCNRRNRSHYHCPCCDFVVNEKGRMSIHFSTHQKNYIKNKIVSTKKAKKKIKSKLVDGLQGVYMVTRNVKGDNIPVHVKAHQNPGDNSINNECSLTQCQSAMVLAWNNGCSQFLCKHLKNIQPETSSLPHNWICDELVYDTLTTKEAQYYQRCTSQFVSINADPVAHWKYSSQFTYFSVFTVKSKHFPFGRLFVKFHRKYKIFKCDCRRISQQSNCIHVILVKIYISKFKLTIDPSNEQSYVPPYKCLTDFEWNYQLEEKKYPVHPEKSLLFLNYEALVKIKKEKLLVPSETLCFSCKRGLSEPILMTSKATICDSKFVVPKVSIFYKICFQCDIRYFYKDIDHGVHVANSTLILSLDLCLLTRGFLKTSTSSGRTGKTVIDLLVSQLGYKCRITDQQFRDSYLNFEIMTNHQYNFTCNICGKYPTILMTDVCRKGFSTFPVSSLNLITDGERDMNEFWQQLHKNILSGADERNLIKNWSPWLSPDNINSAISTESQKGSQKTLTSLDNVLLSEEDIKDIFNKQHKKDIIDQLDNLSITFDKSASKTVLLQKLLSCVFGEDAFNKKMFSIPGGSGGWLAFTCTHGIVYYLKMLLKHESPSDYVDAILSFRFKPAIIICDMPDRIARDLHKRAPNLLQPHLGMLKTPTAENIKLAKCNMIQVNIPSLSIKPSDHVVSDHNYLNNNPVTNSNKIFILYDEFHKVNTKKETEILRHVNLVPQLKLINTESSEQLNSVIGRNHYFLDRMSPLRHYFFLKLLVHLLNNSRNEKNINEMKKISQKSLIKKDDFDRIFLVQMKNSNTSSESSAESEEMSSSSLSLFSLTSQETNDNDDATSSVDKVIEKKKFTFKRITTPIKMTQKDPIQEVNEGLIQDVNDSIGECDHEYELSLRGKINTIGKEGDDSENMKIQENNNNTDTENLESQQDSVSSDTETLSSLQETQHKQTINYDFIQSKEFHHFCNLLTEKNIPSSTLLYELSRIRISAENISSLLPSEYVDDNCIYALSQYFKNHNTGIQIVPPSVGSVFFNTNESCVQEKKKILNLRLQKDKILIPLCIESHWILLVLLPKIHQWYLMDPLMADSCHYTSIRDKFIKFLMTITNQHWENMVVSYQYQTDLRSCGVFVLKYINELCGESTIKAMSIEDLRKHFIALIMNNGKKSRTHCAYCSSKNSPATAQFDAWAECTVCNRWLHTHCMALRKERIDNISNDDVICFICNQMRFHMNKPSQTFRVPIIQKLPVTEPSIPSLTAEEMQNLDDAPLEIIPLEKCKAKKCKGCLKELLPILHKQVPRPTIGIRKPYGRCIYILKRNSHKNVKNFLYTHGKKSCLKKCIKEEKFNIKNFSINIRDRNYILENPLECKRFQKEFGFKLEDL